MVAEHITNLPSDKHSGARARTQMMVVHSAETPLLAGYAASVTTNWLNKMYQANGALIEASINTFFGPDTTVRSVHTDCAAWHASWANSRSVGYEFTGYAALSREQWLTDAGKAMLDRAGREMAADAAHYGIPLRWLTTAEVNAILAGDTTTKGLATHRQIDPGNRTDPGDGFPYDVLLDLIKAYAGGTTPQSTIQEDDFMATPEQVQAFFDHKLTAEDGSTITLGQMVLESRPGRSNIESAIEEIPGAVVNEPFVRINKAGKEAGKTTLAGVVGAQEANVELTRGVIVEAAGAVAKAVAAIPTQSGMDPEEQGKRAAAAFLAEVEGLQLNITAAGGGQ